MAFEPIENYGVIGNMQSIALVGVNGSIDFLCYPEFDSPTVFAALLDDQRGGRFEIRPQIEDMRVRQLYLPDTNILLTRFLAEQGVAELTDYMPIQKDGGQPNQIVRIVSVITGNVKFKMSCQPRFNYAASDHELQSSDCCATFFPAHKDCPPMSLYSSVAIETRSQDISAEFSLQAGESATFVIGGVRNWDYRFTWLRDAAFTLYALILLGFLDETEAFFGWVKGRLGEDAQRGPLQVMYGIDGRQRLDEILLDHLCGYENSRPVRTGNAAYQQLQLDVYGEMMNSLYLANKYGHGISHGEWQEVRRLLEWLGHNWRRPDEGIWEVRGGPREFLHSRVMCWVAFDRALRLAHKRSLSGPLDAWQRTRDEIRSDIFTNFWDSEMQSFVQSKGTKDLDASALLMPMVGFINPVDPMWLSTMRAIEKDLIEDTLVRRYRVERTHVD